MDDKLVRCSTSNIVANFYPKLFDSVSFTYVALQRSLCGVLPVRRAFLSLNGFSPDASLADGVVVELDVVNAHCITTWVVKLH